MRRTAAVFVLAHATDAGWTDDQTAVAVDSVSVFLDDVTAGEATVSFLSPQRVVLPADHPAWVAVRSAPCDLSPLVAACLDAGGDLHGADTLLVVGTLDADREFAVPVTAHGREVRAAYVSCGSTHSVVSHEVGHLLGFEHSWGLHTPAGGAEGPEYGSPYCVMGKAFRDLHVSTTLQPVEGGPPPDAPFWSQAGPRLSAAELLAWRRRTTGRREEPDVHVDEESGDDVVVKDGKPVVVGFPDSRDVLVLELRTATGWDRRLALERSVDGDVFDAPAVVVHRLQDVVDEVSFRADRAWFVGSVAFPASGDRDLEVGGPTSTVIELREHDVKRRRARVHVGPGGERSPHSVELHVEERSRETVVVCAESLGYDAVTFWWEVDGHPVGLGCLGVPATKARAGLATTEVSWDRLTLTIPSRDDVLVRVVALETGSSVWRSEYSLVVRPRWSWFR